MTTTPKTLTVTECHQLLDALLPEKATQKQFRRNLRNYTMALLMLDAGLRVGEVIRLRQTDLLYGDRCVENLLVRANIAKNKRERTVPMSGRIGDAIADMLKCWWSGAFAHAGGYAFYQKSVYKPLTTRQVERIIRAAALKAIGRPVHPHVLRHTFGTRIERTAGIRIAQELLGHQNLASTQIYTHPNEEDKKQAIKRLQNETVGLGKDLENLAGLSGVANRLNTRPANRDMR